MIEIDDNIEMERGIGDNGGPPLVDEFTKPQYELLTTTKAFPAFVAGFGSGKTQALIKRALKLKLAYLSCNIAYYMPTYDLVNTIAFPRFVEAFEQWGMYEGVHFKTVKSQTPRIEVFGGGMIILRTMDRPGRIIGYEVADSLVDELDTLKTEDARQTWLKIMARNRQKKPDGSLNTIAVGTTPEGFKFVYENWHKSPPSDEYQIIRASTYSNARNLPANYIADLLAQYPTALIAAYINGDFVNLTSGAVYPYFDRTTNNSIETALPLEPIHIGMDFNVGKMAAVVFVNRNGNPHAVAEIMNVLDTPAMIAAIKRRFPNNPVFIYPDASGSSRKSNNASVSDIGLLQQAGFNVFVNNSNPAVRDRVLSVNLMLNGSPRGKFFVNVSACPMTAEALEKQAYDKNGEPDKASGFDHPSDAVGYFICYRFPVVNRKVQSVKIGGV